MEDQKKDALMVLPKKIQKSSIMEDGDKRPDFFIKLSERKITGIKLESIMCNYLMDNYVDYIYTRKGRTLFQIRVKEKTDLLAYILCQSIALTIENFSKCNLLFDNSVCKLKNPEIFSASIEKEILGDNHHIDIIYNFERYIIAYFFNKKSTGKFLHIKAIKIKVKEQKIPHEYREKEYKIPYKYFKQGGIKTIPNLFPIIDEIIREAFIFTDNQPSNLIKPRLFFDLDKI